MNTHSLSIEGRRLHFLHKGSGAPILLLHASPMSAASLTPLINALAATHTVIAVDTPGYGHSDEPGEQPTHIGAYADILHNLIKELGLEQFAIYGTATGAQIGIKYALDHPDRVAYLFLDNSAHFTEEEKTKIYASYFPDLSPTEDGGHLKTVWDIADHLFVYFPWCFKEEKYKLATPKPPTPILHKVALEYIKSGANYDWAYRTAFAYEDRERIYELKVPTHIFRWEASILKPYTDRIFEHSLPANVDYSVIPSNADRIQQMAATIHLSYDGPSVKISASTLQSNTVDESEIPDESFPSPEPTGQYLREAWDILGQSQNIDLKNRTRAFVKWAESTL